MSLFNKPKFRKSGFRLALAATLLALAVVMLGTYTRLMDLDFGCPDWPGCYGHLPFLSIVDQVEAYGIYSPGFSFFESGLWAELAHRYLAGILGLMIIVLAVISWRRRDDEAYPFRLPTFILFLVVWQTLFGLWTVKLTLWPQVVTVHLAMGVITCSLLWLLTLRLDNKRWRAEEQVIRQLASVKPWIVVALLLLILQIILGGWTSANNAAMACPDFPSCQHQWWPEMDMKKGFNIIEGFGPETLAQAQDSKQRTAIHVVHRLGAVVTTLYLLAITVFMLTIKHRGPRRISFILIVMLGAQLYLVGGGGQIQTSAVSVLRHNFGAVILLLTLMMLANKVWTAKLKYQRPNL